MSEELVQKVISIIAYTRKIPVEKVKLDSTFEELEIDSLEGLNIVFALENEFNISIPDEEVQQIRSVREVVEKLDRLLKAGPSGSAPASAS